MILSVFTIVFLFWCAVACPTPKQFELRVYRENDQDIFFVRNHTNLAILVSDLAYNTEGSPVLGPQLFYFDEDDLLRNARTNEFVSVQTWEADQKRDLTLLFDKEITFSGFHKQEGFLAHDGNTTFYSCNSYPFDKYVDYLSLDSNCFLAAPVKLRLVYPL